MNFGSILADLFQVGLKALISYFQRGPAPTGPVMVTPPTVTVTSPSPASPIASAPPIAPKPVADNQATLVQVILSQTMDLGPMPGTGGVIHKLTPAQAATVAALIIANCKKYPKLPIALMAAWIRAESDFDAKAIDPNEENWSAKPTAQEKLENQDLGLAQFSWATLAGMPDFAGMSNDEIQTQALDGESSASMMFAFCDSLRQQAEAAIVADSTLLAKLPNKDVTYLYVQAYNSGFAGALSMARSDGPNGNWAYAKSVLGYRDQWQKLFV